MTKAPQRKFKHQPNIMKPTQKLHNLVVGGINTVTFAARHFWRGRGARDAHTLYGSVRSAQRSLRRKGLPPGGLRCFGLGASLLVGHSPTLGDAPSSRLAPSPKQRNERHRIYASDHLGQMPHCKLGKLTFWGNFWEAITAHSHRPAYPAEIAVSSEKDRASV